MTHRLPDLLIFDCDGVLVDSEMIASESLAAHLGEHGVAMSAERCRERFTGYSLDTMMAELMSEGAQLPDDFLVTLRRRDAETFASRLQPIPHVDTFLKHSSTARCVASSGKIEKIRTNLQTTGLLAHFDGRLFSAEMVSKPKPAPDLFLLAAREMGVSPDRCLVIEDSVLGIEAALAAGTRVIGFFGGSHCGPGYAEGLRAAGVPSVFDDMRRLPTLIAG